MAPRPIGAHLPDCCHALPPTRTTQRHQWPGPLWQPEFSVAVASGNGPEPARGVLAEGERAVLNANPFEHVELAQGQRAAAHLADEDLAARLARRQRNGSPLIMVTP